LVPCLPAGRCGFLFVVLVLYYVSEITAQIKDLLETEFPGLWIEGEVTDHRPSPSGHLYFNLKDAFASLSCVIWRDNRTIATVEIRNGNKVRVYGKLRVYVKGGRYNLQVDRVYPIGIGELQIRFEELKRKLKAEGLFDESHKKPLPEWIERIGVITAIGGAAVQDIIRVAKRRYPGIEIIVRSSPVQGEGAAQKIANAIGEFNQFDRETSSHISVLIVGRGGGSIQDLWPFNEEVVARAIFESQIPVISAVGHDIDWTIADLVADCRSPTPSAAAEIAVRDSNELLNNLDDFKTRTGSAIRKKIGAIHDKLLSVEKSYGINRLLDVIHEHWQTLDDMERRLGSAFTQPLSQKREKLGFAVRRFTQEARYFLTRSGKELDETASLLNASMNRFLRDEERELTILVSKMDGMSPRATLARGYSICYKIPEKSVVRKSNELSPRDKVEIEFSEGKTECEVTTVHPNSNIKTE
jgi:exodeoxyribonuclease VII large subunit